MMSYDPEPEIFVDPYSDFLMTQELSRKWSLWIDKTRKIILCKEMPETRKVSFDNGNILG